MAANQSPRLGQQERISMTRNLCSSMGCSKGNAPLWLKRFMKIRGTQKARAKKKQKSSSSPGHLNFLEGQTLTDRTKANYKSIFLIRGFRQAGRSWDENGRRLGQGRRSVHGEDVRRWADRRSGWTTHRSDEIPLPDSFREGEEGYSSHGAVGEGVQKNLPSSFQTTSPLGSGRRNRSGDAWNGTSRFRPSVADLVQYLCQARVSAWTPSGGCSSARGDEGAQTGVHPLVSARTRRDFQNRHHGRHHLRGQFRFPTGAIPQAEGHGQGQQGETFPGYADSVQQALRLC
eukprot:532705-Amphidinium_carterae.1